MKTTKHHLTPCEGRKEGMNGHSAFYCSVNNIVVESNNDVLGDKWYLGESEGFNTAWYPSPTAVAIAYYDAHN